MKEIKIRLNRKLSIKKIVVIGFILLICGISSVRATDIYVSTTTTSGTGTSTDPVNIAGLQTRLATYNVSSGTELNVYFNPGTYSISSVLTFSSTAANVNGLDVLFAPNPDNPGTVTFNGSSNVRFLATTGSTTYPMTVTIEDVTIQGFTSTVPASTTGTTSLFTLVAGSTLNLTNVVVNNITSNGYTLVSATGTEATFSVNSSTLSNITSNTTYLWRTSGTDGAFSFGDCTLSNWTATAGAAMFYLSSNDGCSLSITNSLISGFQALGGHLFYLNQADNSLTLSGNTFTLNRTGPSTPGGNTYNFVNAIAGAGEFTISDNTFTGNRTNGAFILNVRSGASITGNTFEQDSTVHSVVGTNVPFISSTATADIETNIFTNNTAHGNFIYGTGSSISLSGNRFTGNRSGGNAVERNSFVYLTGAPNKVTFNTFDSNQPTTSGTVGHILYVTGTGTKILNNTFKANAPTNNGYVVNIGAGAASPNNNIISNNTFSGNTSGYAVNIAGNLVKMFNNTVYNSGRVNFATSYANSRVINNIVAPGANDTIIIVTNNADRTLRNIIRNRFYASGVTSGTDVSAAFAAQFNTTLSGTEPGREVHDLNPTYYYSAGNVILRRGSTFTALLNELDISATYLPTYLATDQVGTTRNQSGNISIGAVDIYGIFDVQDGRIRVTYDVDNPLPLPQQYDLRNLIVKYPEGVTSADVTFSLAGGNTQTLANGTVLLDNNGILHFAPANDGTTFNGTNAISTLQFTVSESVTGTALSSVARQLTLSVFEVGRVPGLIEPNDYPNTCYDLMGVVDFTSAFRFRVSTATPSEDRLYGFSIPLVGDLDNDGYPEILGIGRTNNSSSLDPNYRYLYIYSGQTGARLAKLNLDMTTAGNGYVGHGGYHGSPSIMAMVDADRNGKKEVIIAFPGSNSGGNFPYRYRLVSYELAPEPMGTVNKYSMALKWGNQVADQPIYNLGGSSGTVAQNSYQRAVPQIVDIEGNGDAMVVVYNKIYDAKTGKLKVTLGKLGVDAYVGAASTNARSDDGLINFSYIYDLDMDGKYDIVAGGKVYYDIDIASGTYQTLDFSASVKDGRTGVADIDGDGIPDIVVVNRVSSGSSLNIYVWDPDFLRLDANGTIVRNSGVKVPKLKASRTVPLDRRTTGTNSYVYIGDIDGREQSVVINGVTKKYKLPEIAILGGHFTYSSGILHPNIRSFSGTGVMPTSGSSSSASGTAGVLAAFTWDADPTANSADRLKLSFVLGHNDTSGNTGFTMFDFDNDGVQEICYRDEQTLRIIKAARPYIAASITDPSVILFREAAVSYTGFEYPVIADIDNDASAEMVVVAKTPTGSQAFGYMFAVGNGSGDKFAPARPVWNQFMYDPFKINDNLQTPVGPAPNRLDTAYNYKLQVKDVNGAILKTIENYNPYNATLNQVAIHRAHVDGSDVLYEPIVFLTEAYIVDINDPVASRRPTLRVVGSNRYIYLVIGNHASAKTSISLNTPIAIYRENLISQGTFVRKWLLTELTDTLGNALLSAIHPGQEVAIRIPLTTPDTELGTYWVRLGDNSGTSGGNWVWRFGLNSLDDGTPNSALGIGVASRAYRDCYWPDQSVRASRYRPFNDAVTVQEFNSVVIPVFDNDILPDFLDNNFYNSVTALSDAYISMPPKAGTLSYSGSGKNAVIMYQHEGLQVLTNGIDSFKYVVTFLDPANGNASKTDSATVYIYVMESAMGSFSVCYGSVSTIKLANKPPGVTFDWYETATSFETLGTGLTRTMAGPQYVDSTYWLKPQIPFAHPYSTLDFPRALLTIHVVNNAVGAISTMRWTGLVNSFWNNPGNWSEVVTENGHTYEVPVAWSPTECVDVKISSNAPHYPELTDSVFIHNIKMEDRAMLKNPHVLIYDSAQVEIKLKLSERDRYVMWSAPLKDMYSGDYHFKNGITPQWGDTYMSFFQQVNPDGVGTFNDNSLTAPFGDVGTPLELGKAFNLKVTTTTVTRDNLLIFPRSETSYTDSQGTSYGPLSRSPQSKFITEGVFLYPDTTFALKIWSYHTGNQGGYIQVVNPYLAYLDVSKFLAGNSTTLSPSGYVIWNGDLDNGMQYVTAMQAYTYVTPPGSSPGLIPPLQSFFVVRPNGVPPLTTVKMSPNWTQTYSPQEDSYTLRSAASSSTESGVLFIKAAQGKKTSYATLLYEPDAVPSYNVEEDMQTLFYDDIPLTLYSLTAQREALSVNANGDFQSRETDLGLRLREAGEMKLEFIGIGEFGYNVFLKDKLLDKEIDLQQTPEYTFVVTKPTDVKVVEVNDRFSLRMDYTGTVDVRPTAAPTFIVTSQNSEIHVRSTSGSIRNLQIYTIDGALIYRSDTGAESYRVHVERGHIYVVKGQVGGTQEVRKVLVK